MSKELDFPFTYSGLLDDRMALYGPKMNTKQFFQRMIAKNLFFGGGIYINDGYLVNHPLARSYLANENSLLRSMLRYGFIKIFTRERTADGLAKMPDRMAGLKIESFQKLIESDEWKKGFQRIWWDISEWAFDTKNAVAWPNRDMSYGFCKLMLRAFNSKPEDIGINLPRTALMRICQDFFSRGPLQSGPRDKLEKSAKLILDDSELRSNQRKTALREIMNVANQAYHYNFGLCLTNEMGVTNTRAYANGGAICVDTTIGKAFDELLLEDPIDEYVLKRIPLFGIPLDFRFDKGAIFEPLVKAGSRAYQAKLKFAVAIQSAILNKAGTKDSPKQIRLRVKEAMIDYVNAMLVELPFNVEEAAFFDDAFGHSVSQGPSVVATESGSVIGSTSSCMTQAISAATSGKGMDFLVRRGVLSKTKRFSVHEVRPQISSLLFNLEKATDFVSDIPTF